MPNVNSIASFEALVSRLEEEKIPFRHGKEKGVVSVPTRLGEENSVLHIRWEAIPGVVQFIQMMPFAVPPERIDKVAILLGRINVALPILGFTLNPENGVLAYRTHAFLGKEVAIAPGMIGALIGNSARTAKNYLPQLRAAAMEVARVNVG